MVSTNYNEQLAELLSEIRVAQNNIDRLSITVEKLTTMFVSHMDKDTILNNRLVIFEQNQIRLEKSVEQLNKLLVEGNQKEDGLVKQLNDLKRGVEEGIKKAKEDKEESKKRAIQREKDNVVVAENKDKVFNRKMLVLMAIISILAFLIPTMVTLLIYQLDKNPIQSPIKIEAK